MKFIIVDLDTSLPDYYNFAVWLVAIPFLTLGFASFVIGLFLQLFNAYKINKKYNLSAQSKIDT